jgi:hypothetical protein
MNTVYFDATTSDDVRRQLLYEGQLFVFSPTPSSLALVAFARELIKKAFGTLDPETAQYEMPVERFAATLAELKPTFIHHPESKRFLQLMLSERGCDLEKTYFDVPRLRTATSDDYLTTGISYAFHPHRDTWYSAPQCQLNWWLPIYEIESNRSMAFHPRYWSRPIRNSSRTYNYTEWNQKSRFNASQHIKSDTRVQPRAEEPIEVDPQIRVITPVGGVLIFSGAQLHSTVQNTTGRTRFSIDFRTVNIDDATELRGAPNVDSECTGTSMNDYLRAIDLAHLPTEIVAMYEPGPGSRR